jgi:hypothetical protein
MLKATVVANTSFFCAFVIVTYLPVDPSFPVEHHIIKKNNVALAGGALSFPFPQDSLPKPLGALYASVRRFPTLHSRLASAFGVKVALNWPSKEEPWALAGEAARCHFLVATGLRPTRLAGNFFPLVRPGFLPGNNSPMRAAG